MMTALNILVLIGAAMHLASIYLVSKLVRELPQDNLRQGWKILGIFIFFFFVSYLVYVFLQQSRTGELSGVDLIAPFILFFGAIFVLLVNLLSLKTTLELKRICTLEQENITDPLLGIYNRRYLEEMLELEFRLSRRDGLPLSILLLDIDHFKEVNDKHGHLAGDRTLLNLVQEIKGNLRETDQLARYGGEEILIMLPHTPEDGAKLVAEKIRRGIAGGIMVAAGEREDEGWPDISITVSIGVAGLRDEFSSGKELFAKADQALYRAKKTGRNRCVAASELEQKKK
ncbi:GGDEF domain-containing protein [Desulfurivibrio alkaliphilus]|uniref:diguanylate cyclase n=1 Tax=Desulfurivibrio alkaliphilus (strain DSM 19089 / UNIQEM U267 / AHT2) TaxID=589865 RepID=D6Z5N6_DESAT|nr:GGDEF domain-containing protein [Desulfurivibrio alkaliphilus]ADH86773.1 diguanylate cyclase [Desulfurivibrio alkaliphilus AHT 2]